MLITIYLVFSHLLVWLHIFSSEMKMLADLFFVEMEVYYAKINYFWRFSSLKSINFYGYSKGSENENFLKLLFLELPPSQRVYKSKLCKIIYLFEDYHLDLT